MFDWITRILTRRGANTGRKDLALLQGDEAKIYRDLGNAALKLEEIQRSLPKEMRDRHSFIMSMNEVHVLIANAISRTRSAMRLINNEEAVNDWRRSHLLEILAILQRIELSAQSHGDKYTVKEITRVMEHIERETKS